MTDLLFINCDYAGISGDMLLSSLAHIIGIEKMQAFLAKILKNLPQVQDFHVSFVSKTSQGIGGYHLDMNISQKHSNNQSHIDKTKLSISSVLNQKKQDFPHMEVSTNFLKPPHKSSHHHHYHLDQMKADLKRSMELGGISQLGQEVGANVLDLIIQAEANVHQKEIDTVHLHELGGVDTILDIAGTMYGLEVLGVFSSKHSVDIFASSIAVGGGTVKCAHGIMPVPAPATSQLLQMSNLKFLHGPVQFELATPTGVAILGVLKQKELLKQTSPPKPYQLHHVGVGVGSHEFSSHANILRINYGYYDQ